MKVSNKTLLIHEDAKKNTTTSVVIDEHEVVQKTKEFLERLTKSHKKTSVKVYSPLGIVLRAADNEKEEYAVAYEEEKFVIVLPNGTLQSAKLYGNWHEALLCAQKLLAEQGVPEKKSRIVLAQYIKATE